MVLRAGGVDPDVVPARSASEGVIEAIADRELRRAVVVRAQDGRELLLDHLRERGVDTTLFAPYRTEAVALPDELRDAALACDYALFASGSSARSFAASAGAGAGWPRRVVSIGPATSAVLRELGADVALEAGPHTPDGLLEALLDDVRSRAE